MVVEGATGKSDGLWCARLSLACLVDESSTMLIAHSACSDPGAGGSNPFWRSPGYQIREPERKRIRFGLVTSKYGHGQPVTKGEARRLQALNELMCLEGGPGWLGEARGERQVEEPGRSLGVDKIQRLGRMHKPLPASWEVGGVRSSEEGSNDPGAKGRCCRSVHIDTRSSA